uniref:Alpha-amylase A n=2 Tax=Halothermothrix orenii TaxID=31909 RepID=Q8GPL8_9FIRM|nr:alpha-amylase A [Halothermothrix orenii]
MKLKRLSFFMFVTLLVFISVFPVYANDFEKHGTYYEIFVRSFYDSDGDGIGDLKGIIEKLDYLNDGDPETIADLGVNGIWLMPIFKSPSYHGYDVTDYYKINPDYGTLEDFHKLVEAAHQRGIKVIIDLPINHTSERHPWFLKASRDKNSEYRDYYVWAGPDTDTKETKLDGGRVWHYSPTGMYYGYFWSGMPDLNYNNPEVQEKVIGIAKYWLKQGVDGFRLDGAMHIFPPAQYDKNFTWWEKFRQEIEEVKPVYLVGEVWDISETVAPYFKYGFDSTFNFKLAEAVIATAKAGFPFGFNKKAKHIYGVYDREVGFGNYIDAPFLTNHDQNRILDQLGQDRNKARVAASIYLTLPGNPFIYYGEEIGMRGQGPHEVIREPFQWYNGSGEGETYWEPAMYNDGFTSVEQEEKNLDSLLNHYRRLIHFRNENPVFYTGKIEIINGGLNVVAFRRYNDKRDLYVYHNLVNRPVKIKVASGNWTLLFNSGDKEITPVEDNNKLMYTIPAYTTIVLEKE